MDTDRLGLALVFVIFLLGSALTTSVGASVVPGDFDDDGDVDLADFERFQRCVLGSNIPQPDQQCVEAHLDADEDVDLADFELFVGCFGGVDNPSDPNCICPAGQTNCAGRCVDTAYDDANCGACGSACAGGLVCQSATCLAPCGAPLTLCGGICVDLTYNNANCGSCGHVCVGDLTCVGGVCDFISGPAQPCLDCRGDAEVIPGDFDGDGDVDLADFVHFQTCALGPEIAQTNPVCSNAQIDADQDVDLDDFEIFRRCLSGAGNPADPNCACASGETNCDGTCINTQADSANCGACGNACATGLICQNGACATCGGGTTACGGECVDLMWDSRHCGTCGSVCPEQTACAWGQCEGLCIGCE